MNRPAALFLIPLALSAASISPSAYIAHIKFLASPELKGRASGSPELEKAAHYIADQYRSSGVKPIPGHDYLQAFEVTTSAHIGAGNRLELIDHGHGRTLD